MFAKESETEKLKGVGSKCISDEEKTNWER